MFWHIDTDIVSLIVMVALFIFYVKLPTRNIQDKRNGQFLRCLQMGIDVAVIDILASIVMEIPVSRFIYHLFMTTYFTTIELVIVQWFLYVLTIIFSKDERLYRISSRVVLVIYFLYAAMAVTNPWTGFIYTLSPDSVYARGPMFAAMVILYGLYTIALFALIIIRWKSIPKEYPAWVLLTTPVIIAIGIIAQLSYPGLLLIVPSYMICMVLASLFLQTMNVRTSQRLVADLSKAAETDTLTGLFNRTGMEMMVHKTLMESYGKGVVVLIADMDNLKGINDTMGHKEGDRAIKLMADALKNRLRATDTIVRYGGDEFLAFVVGDFDERSMNTLLQAIIDEFRDLRIGEDNSVPLFGSIGACKGIVGTDSFDNLCNKADIALYHVKRSGKNAYAVYDSSMEN